MVDGAPLLPLSDDEPSLSDDERTQVERLSRLCLYEIRSFHHLNTAVVWAFFPQYLGLPLFFWLGAREMLKISYFLQVLLLAGLSNLQLSGFKYLVEGADVPRGRFRCGKTLRGRARALLRPLSTIMGIPITCLGLCQWQFDLISLAPNSLDIISTVQAVAMVERQWIGCEEVFRRRWEDVAVIGQYVGEAGLPCILKVSVIMDMAVHSFFLFHDFANPRALFGLAEAANLFFLEKSTNNERAFHAVRSLSAPLVKIPMIWMKISLLALLYDSLDWAAKGSLLIAILLALYGLVLLLPGCASMIWLIVDPNGDRDSNLLHLWRSGQLALVAVNSGMLFLLLAFGVLLAVVLVHLAGVVVCPSHDLSVTHGCTEKLHIAGDAAHASGL